MRRLLFTLSIALLVLGGVLALPDRAPVLRDTSPGKVVMTLGPERAAAQVGPLPGMAVLPSPSLRPVTTVFNVVFNANDTGDSGFSFRYVTPALTGTGTYAQSRITMVASTATTCTVNHISAGYSASSVDGNTSTTPGGSPGGTPVEFLTGGASGMSLATNTSQVTDWANFAVTAGTQVVLIWDAGTCGGIRRNTSVSSGSWLKSGAATYNVANISGLGGSFVSGTDWGTMTLEAR